MKTRVLLALVIAAATPLVFVAGCSDSSSQTDGGPQNEAGGNDAAVDSNPGTDSGTDGGNTCTTGLVFDNTLVPGWPNNVPQP